MKLMIQISIKGHFEMRILFRSRDGDLKEAASKSGPSDNIVSKSPKFIFNSSIKVRLRII